MVVDLRRVRTPLIPISIQGVTVDIVEDYKYLRVFNDHKLGCAKNTDALCCLRMLRSFNICCGENV